MSEREQRYKLIPAPEIESTGIADLMRTPADGIKRNSHLDRDGARFAVAANVEDGLPHHAIIVEFSDPNSETGRSFQGMSIAMGQDGLPETIATVSGGHPEGRARLSEEQKGVLGQLIERSIEAGESEPEPWSSTDFDT